MLLRENIYTIIDIVEKFSPALLTWHVTSGLTQESNLTGRRLFHFSIVSEIDLFTNYHKCINCKFKSICWLAVDCLVVAKGLGCWGRPADQSRGAEVWLCFCCLRLIASCPRIGTQLKISFVYCNLGGNNEIVFSRDSQLSELIQPQEKI